MIDCDPIRGHEQGSRRPCLVVSVNPFNHSGAALVIGIPLTTRQRLVISHVPVVPPDGGVRRSSSIMYEQVRACA
ncbi:MAG: type II toxin-antitoxin system PemK/MazF family toxin [Chloroflexota bacterium]|nr:type II toxin-antitoxin system PemK/MazF family toxin [Chloroflexota bacterium]